MGVVEFMVVVTGVTSGLMVTLACAVLGWPLSGLVRALGRMLEAVGVSAAFLVVNVAMAAALVFGSRAVTGDFVSIYVAGKLTWLGVSLLQGLTFHAWWRGWGASLLPR
jgi:hypothetical protein